MTLKNISTRDFDTELHLQRLSHPWHSQRDVLLQCWRGFRWMIAPQSGKGYYSFEA